MISPQPYCPLSSATLVGSRQEHSGTTICEHAGMTNWELSCPQSAIQVHSLRACGDDKVKNTREPQFHSCHPRVLLSGVHLHRQNRCGSPTRAFGDDKSIAATPECFCRGSNTRCQLRCGFPPGARGNDKLGAFGDDR